MSNPLLLYDGMCGLCNRMVRFVLRHDRKGVFRFAPLQSALAAHILARHHIDPTELDTFYVILDYNPQKEDQVREALLARSDGMLFLLGNMGGIWRAAAWILRVLPRTLRDAAYKMIARNRYRIFGRYDSCPVPSAETRSRFVDL